MEPRLYFCRTGLRTIDTSHDLFFTAPLNSWQARDINDRPDLDGPLTRHGNPCCDSDGLVAMLGLNEKVATELFARLCEWTIGDEPFAIAHAHSGCHRCRMQ